MNDFPVFFGTLSSDVVFELFDPSVTFFSVGPSERFYRKYIARRRGSENLLLRIEHVPEQNTSTGLVDADRQGLVLCLGLDGRALLVSTV